jgi:propanol-preferring alcohol dehydrogenase
VAISGLGGLGHIAVQYGKAMGLHVIGVDVTDDKLALARDFGADVTVNARSPDAVAHVLKATGGGAHRVPLCRRLHWHKRCVLRGAEEQ